MRRFCRYRLRFNSRSCGPCLGSKQSTQVAPTAHAGLAGRKPATPTAKKELVRNGRPATARPLSARLRAAARDARRQQRAVAPLGRTGGMNRGKAGGPRRRDRRSAFRDSTACRSSRCSAATDRLLAGLKLRLGSAPLLISTVGASALPFVVVRFKSSRTATSGRQRKTAAAIDAPPSRPQTDKLRRCHERPTLWRCAVGQIHGDNRRFTQRKCPARSLSRNNDSGPPGWCHHD